MRERANHLSALTEGGDPTGEDVDRPVPIPPGLIACLPAQFLRRRIVIKDDEQIMIAIWTRFASGDRPEENDAQGIEIGHHALQERRRNQQGCRTVRFGTRSHHLRTLTLVPIGAMTLNSQ